MMFTNNLEQAILMRNECLFLSILSLIIAFLGFVAIIISNSPIGGMIVIAVFGFGFVISFMQVMAAVEEIVIHKSKEQNKLE